MSYDPDLSAAQFPMERLPEAIRSHYTPVGYDLEPELKVSVNTPSHLLIRSALSKDDPESDYIQTAFLAFAKSFHRNALGEESYIDASGVTPRDYALVNLGQDTGRRYGGWVLPQMDVTNNGYQYRERFALSVFNGKPLQEVGITNFDTNAKTLLSNGVHRKEFETEVDFRDTDKDTFESFRQIKNLPDFFHSINADNLYVIKTWMTSRTSFITLTRIPNTQLFALCEHCCDITRYTTANFEQFIDGGRKDPEWETEIKGFFGTDPRLSTEQGQMELIEALFTDIYGRMKLINPDITTNDLSKMERAKDRTAKFYAPVSVYKDISGKNTPFTKHFESVGVCPGLAHAFVHAVRSKDITNPTFLPRIIGLAKAMPDPKDILDSAALKKHTLSGETYHPAYNVA